MTNPHETKTQSWPEVRDKWIRENVSDSAVAKILAKQSADFGYQTAKSEEFAKNNELRAEIHSLENSHKAAVRYANQARELEKQLEVKTAARDVEVAELYEINKRVRKQNVDLKLSLIQLETQLAECRAELKVFTDEVPFTSANAAIKYYKQRTNELETQHATLVDVLIKAKSTLLSLNSEYENFVYEEGSEEIEEEVKATFDLVDETLKTFNAKVGKV